MTDLTQFTHADVTELARTQTELRGELPLAALRRLAGDVLPATADAAPMQWQLKAYAKSQPGQAEASIWLHMAATMDVRVSCQSCLEPMDVSLRVDQTFRFVASEEQALLEDDDSDEDVLSEPEDVDLFALLEDELLLALPLVPRHGGCIAQYQAVDEPEVVEEKPHPFAALASLKKPS